MIKTHDFLIQAVDNYLETLSQKGYLSHNRYPGMGYLPQQIFSDLRHILTGYTNDELTNLTHKVLSGDYDPNAPVDSLYLDTQPYVSHLSICADSSRFYLLHYPLVVRQALIIHHVATGLCIIKDRGSSENIPISKKQFDSYWTVYPNNEPEPLKLQNAHHVRLILSYGIILKDLDKKYVRILIDPTNKIIPEAPKLEAPNIEPVPLDPHIITCSNALHDTPEDTIDDKNTAEITEEVLSALNQLLNSSL